MQMKEKIRVRLAGLLLGTDNGCITTNPNQSVLQGNGIILVHLEPKCSKFKVTPSAGKAMLAVFCYSQGVLLTNFQKRGENVNSASYCEVLLKFRDAISRKGPGQLARGVLLHHDNAGPHTARATQERIQELKWQLLEYPPYSPDLAPSDFPLSGPLKNHLGGTRFADDEEVETEMRKWLRRSQKTLCCRFRRTGKATGQVYQC
jgi:histone-lysine N-methyltransferase SETMAR